MPNLISANSSRCDWVPIFSTQFAANYHFEKKKAYEPFAEHMNTPKFLRPFRNW